MSVTRTPPVTQRRLTARKTVSVPETLSASGTVTRRECVAANIHLFRKENTASWSVETAQPRTHAQRTRNAFSLARATASASAPRASLSRSLGFVEISTNAKKPASIPHAVPMPSVVMRREHTIVSVRQDILETLDKAALPFAFAAETIRIVHQMKSVFVGSVSVYLHTSWKVILAKILVLGFSAASMQRVPSRHQDRSASVTLVAPVTLRLAVGM